MFRGVYARDKLPARLGKLPALLVANTDIAAKPGAHWIAMFIDVDGFGEYFDSFAELPHTTFKTYMDKHCKHWVANKKQLQSVVSRFCGAHVTVFCAYRSKGFSMHKITTMYTNDYGLNDVLSHTLVCRRLRY
jgi:hypothetical protein